MSNQLTEQDKQMLRMFNQLNPDKVKLVECKPMPECVREQVLRNRINFKECYNNATKAVLTLNWSHKLSSTVRFVLGVADMALGFHGHAWIEVGGVQHDPTFEILGQGIEKRKYFEVRRFTVDELYDFLEASDSVPPSFPDDAPEDAFDFSYWRTITETLSKAKVAHTV